MTYFDACDSLGDLKAAYKRLALKFHPDCGGDLRTMQEVNAEYDDVFAVLKRERNARAKEPESRVRPTTEAPEEFRAIVEALLKLDGLDVELCGSWLWIGGDTYRHRSALKEAGVGRNRLIISALRSTARTAFALRHPASINEKSARSISPRCLSAAISVRGCCRFSALGGISDLRCRLCNP